MDNSCVNQLLSSWSGGTFLLESMKASGFFIPDRFIDFSAAILGIPATKWRKELTSYSCEYVRLGGELKNVSTIATKLAYCRSELVINPAVRDRYLLLESRWKKEEIVSDPVYENDWLDKKSHLRVVAKRLAKAEGYQTTTKGYWIELPGDLRLVIEVDVGRPGSTIRQVVFLSRIISKDRRWEFWLPLSELVPGMHAYMNGNDSATLVWGIKAFVAASKAFGNSFHL